MMFIHTGMGTLKVGLYTNNSYFKLYHFRYIFTATQNCQGKE